MPEVLFSHDPSKPMAEQAVPGHNRIHPDVPAAATARPGQEFRVECREWTDGQIGNNDSANDVRDVDLDRCHMLSGPVRVEGAEPGDLLILSGSLGAGKTTLTRGLGEGLGVRGAVTSPTFVISRIHPSLTGGPDLVHVDAYRLGGADEIDDIDLDATLHDSVTVVEWGKGVAEELSDQRLEISIERHPDDTRTVHLHAVGTRWSHSELPGHAGRR